MLFSVKKNRWKMKKQKKVFEAKTVKVLEDRHFKNTFAQELL